MEDKPLPQGQHSGNRLLTAFRTSWWCFRFAFRTRPWLLVSLVVITLIVSLVPSLQTVLVTQLTGAVSNRDKAGALAWAVGTGLVVAGYYGVQQVCYTLSRMVQITAAVRAHELVNSTLSRLTPVQLTDPEVSAQARAARESIDSTKFPMHTVALTAVGFSFLMSVSLLATIWQVSPWAALMLLLSLFPMTASNLYYATVDNKKWPQVTEAQRYAAYREDQLAYQQTSVELATYDAMGMMGDKASHYRRQRGALQISLERLSILTDSLAGLCTAGLLIAALVVMISSGASVGQISGGVVGILSGIIAMTGSAYAFGEMMTAANAVDSFIAFVELGERAAAPAPLAPVLGLSAKPAFGSTSADSASAGSANQANSASRLASANPTNQLVSVKSMNPVDSLELVDISVTYPNNPHPTVEGINLKASRGQLIGLVGPNGAGKSTIVKALLGLVDVGGQVRVNGQDLAADGFARHRYFGLLSQEYGRYELTVKENLLLGKPQGPVRDEDLWKALSAAHADDIVRHLPEALNTQLGSQWKGAGLSGGQWQRLALARLYLRDAPIRILDEATSNIDSETEEKIFEELRNNSQGYITLVVSHRVWTLRSLDMIYVVDHGQVVESGSYATLDRQGTRFHQLFASQEKDAGSR